MILLCNNSISIWTGNAECLAEGFQNPAPMTLCIPAFAPPPSIDHLKCNALPGLHDFSGGMFRDQSCYITPICKRQNSWHLVEHTNSTHQVPFNQRSKNKEALFVAHWCCQFGIANVVKLPWLDICPNTRTVSEWRTKCQLRSKWCVLKCLNWLEREREHEC